MSAELRISVVLAVQQAGSSLVRAIQSMVDQSWTNWELLVVSDDSPAECGNAVAGLVASFKDERIRHVAIRCDESKHPEIEKLRRGAALAKGELIAFLESGCAFQIDHLWHCAQSFIACQDAINEHPLDLVYSDNAVVCESRAGSDNLLQKAIALHFNVLGTILGEEFARDLKKGIPLLSLIAPGDGAPFIRKKPEWNAAAEQRLETYNFIGISDVLMTRKAYESVGGFRDCHYADWRLWRDFLRTGQCHFRRVPHAGVIYRTTSLDHHRRYYELSQQPPAARNPRKLVQTAIRNALNVSHGNAARGRRASGRPRILFMGDTAALSHIARPWLLARYMHSKGYEVCFARDPRYKHLTPTNEFSEVDLVSLPASDVINRLSRTEPVFDFSTLHRYVEADLEVIAEFKPDIVVGDSRCSLAVSGRLAGIPYINIADAQWSPSVDIAFELTDSPLSRLLGMPLSNLIFNFSHPFAFIFQTIPINLVRLKFGLPGIGFDVKSFATYGDYTIYPNDPELFPLKRPLPPGHMFIGPLIWSPQMEKPEWWNRLPKDRPVVYVSLGSTGQPRLMGAIFNVLAELKVTVIAATSGRTAAMRVPHNAFVADFIPGAEAARLSRLVICNGGAMSGPQALSAGVPYLGLISNMDQMLFSKTVRRAGACELLREGEVNEETLRPVIRKMLAQESYHAAARRIAARTTALDPYGAFEQLICSIASVSVPKHGESRLEMTAAELKN